MHIKNIVLHFLCVNGGWFDVNDNDINRRIRIHLEAKNEKKCSVGAWLNDTSAGARAMHGFGAL